MEVIQAKMSFFCVINEAEHSGQYAQLLCNEITFMFGQ